MPSKATYFRYARLRDLARSRPADPRAWLHADELREYGQLSDRRRREQWLGGRWLAKRLIQQAFTPCLHEYGLLCIRSRDRAGRGIRPRVLLRGEPRCWSLSIAHSESAVLAAVTASPGNLLGVDLVECRRLPDSVGKTWFTDKERAWLRLEDPREAATLWALKEAIYKALQNGEGFAPRRIEVRALDTGGYTGTYHELPLDAVCRLHVWKPRPHVAAVAIGGRAAGTSGPLVPLLEPLKLDRVGGAR